MEGRTWKRGHFFRPVDMFSLKSFLPKCKKKGISNLYNHSFPVLGQVDVV